MANFKFTTLAAVLAVSGCSEPPQSTAPAPVEPPNQIEMAEALIDAFYSFDPEQLAPLLTSAGPAAARVLYYQGWAEGGNYKVVNRAPCVGGENNTVVCAITVEDDPVLALNTGFNVTDTFTLTFADNKITDVKTSSNDQPIYYHAREWVMENLPEIATGPCEGFFDGGKTPGDCARAMTEGYRQFAAQRERSPTLVPADFEVPVLVETEGFKVVPLGPDLMQIDYDAYMSSIEHLQATFTRSTSWPHANLTLDDALLDMQTEAARFEARESFAYAVLTPDGTRERGCIYVLPSKANAYDAVVRLWVTQEELDQGFDPALYDWAQKWVTEQWPFKSVAYPGRMIPWDNWDKLVQ